MDSDDDILSQIAVGLENEYFELKSLDDSAENCMLSQALDTIDYECFIGRKCKTYQCGIGQMSLTNKDIKHYCAEGPRCFATHFQVYLDAMGNEGPFYRRPLASQAGVESIRYSLQPVGMNTLQKFMSEIAKRGDLKGNFTNHSGKRTCATALYNAGIDEQDIMDRTRHRSAAGVRKYKRANDTTRQRVSNVLDPEGIKADLGCVASPPFTVDPDESIPAKMKASAAVSNDDSHGKLLSDLKNASFTGCTFNF